MIVLRIIFIIISSLLLGAHFMREGNNGLLLLSLAAPLLLLLRRRWAFNALFVLLTAGAGVWVQTAATMVQVRIDGGQPWARMAVIMSLVALSAIAAAATALSLKKTSLSDGDTGGERAGTAAFVVTAAIIITAKIKVSFPILIFDRFLPGTGWVEILLLSAYAGRLAEIMLASEAHSRVRSRIWTAFTIVFFSQLALGLSGFDRFLMTGKLHLPVPAVIIGGPLYRGGGYFMPILFASTILLAGPAWCSYICYFGAGDNLAARSKKIPGRMERWMGISRIATLVAVIAAALNFRVFGVPPLPAALSAAAFGAAGIGIMIFISRRRGIMAHCLAWCPVGLVADLAGKISPFRIRIADTCTDCGACRSACRYGALERGNIAARRPGLTCTLCGDCLAACGKKSFSYRFPGLGPDASRLLFTVIVVSLHACSMGLARI